MKLMPAMKSCQLWCKAWPLPEILSVFLIILVWLMISHRGSASPILREWSEGRFQQQIVFLICFRSCNNHKNMNNKLTSMIWSSPASRPECRDSSLSWKIQTGTSGLWKQNCRWTDITAVPFNINLLLFRKLLSFAVYHVKVRTQCRLHSVCKIWFISCQATRHE